MNKGHPTYEIFPVHPALFAWLCAPPRPPPAPLRFRALVEVAEKERSFMLWTERVRSRHTPNQPDASRSVKPNLGGKP